MYVTRVPGLGVGSSSTLETALKTKSPANVSKLDQENLEGALIFYKHLITHCCQPGAPELTPEERCNIQLKQMRESPTVRTLYESMDYQTTLFDHGRPAAIFF
uniref:Uncharacterized protein n=1 Tax=Romanomermis culicivorax TaxID=13658 RepID=A0A915K528_ROMCU